MARRTTTKPTKTSRAVSGPRSVGTDDSSSCESPSSITPENEYSFRCFMVHRDPAHAAKLESTRYSSCNSLFPNVNRLREHIVRSHSLSHNCRGCRHRITKMKEIPAFQVKHARCMTHPVQKMRAGPKPELLDAAQTAALSKLNQHFDKPNDEVIRCQKLWKALFPTEPFDPRVMEKSGPKSQRVQDVNSPTTPSRAARGWSPSGTSPSNAARLHDGPLTPAPTPRTAASPGSPHPRGGDTYPAQDAAGKPMFSMVPSPKPGSYETQPSKSSWHDSAIDMRPGSADGDEAARQDTHGRGGGMHNGLPRYGSETQDTQNLDIEAVAGHLPTASELAKHQHNTIDIEDDEGEEDDDCEYEAVPFRVGDVCMRDSACGSSNRSSTRDSAGSDMDTDSAFGVADEDDEIAADLFHGDCYRDTYVYEQETLDLINAGFVGINGPRIGDWGLCESEDEESFSTSSMSIDEGD